jgi:hypothetical protein
MACSEDGVLRWMTGRYTPDCELYAVQGFGRAPLLYTAPQPSPAPVECSMSIKDVLHICPVENPMYWSVSLAAQKEEAQELEIAGLVEALEKAARHVRPTCTALYEELQQVLAAHRQQEQQEKQS